MERLTIDFKVANLPYFALPTLTDFRELALVVFVRVLVAWASSLVEAAICCSLFFYGFYICVINMYRRGTIYTGYSGLYG